MILVDLNILIYAVNEDARQHSKARAWWERTLSEGVPVGLTWSVLTGFLRLTTHPRVMPKPLSSEDAIAVVEGWLAQPNIDVVEPGERHWDILKEQLQELGTAGNLTTDAHLAATAIEHGARLASTDNDFARFRGLRWINPL